MHHLKKDSMGYPKSSTINHRDKQSFKYRIESLPIMGKGFMKVTVIEGKNKGKEVILKEMPISLAYFNE